ncbi:MAG: HAMP domain-containing sensor histidine kinase [Minicystis sp.]
MARRNMTVLGGNDGASTPLDGGHGWVRDEFLTLASHELMTPLTTLKLQVQAMKHKADREPAASPDWAVSMLAVFDRQIGRLAGLVDDLMLTTRIQSGELTPIMEEAELDEIVREVVADVASQCRCAVSSITLEVEEGLAGSWDRGLIGRVVFHLLKNAVTFGEHRPITVEVRSTARGLARITVRDRGIGIAKEDLDRIFGCFERAVPVEHFGGLGIGLYLAREIVRAHGGTIAVESEPGAGATFTVELPLAEETEDALAA